MVAHDNDRRRDLLKTIDLIQLFQVHDNKASKACGIIVRTVKTHDDGCGAFAAPRLAGRLSGEGSAPL